MQQKTILSTLLLSALSTLSASALAETQKDLNIWHSMGSFSLPAKRSTSVGAIGAEFFAYDNVKGTSSTLEQKAEAGIHGWIFSDNRRTLISVFAHGTSTGSTDDLAVGFTILGQDVSFSPSGLSANYGKCGISRSPSAQVWIGPIPVVAEFEGGFCEGISVSGSASSSGGTRQLGFSITPDASLGAEVSVGVGFSAASVGVKGSVSLVDASLPIHNTIKLSPTNQLTASSNGTVHIDFLKGEINFYAKAGWGPFSVEYNKEFFSWTGYSKAYLVFSDMDPMATNVDLTFNITGPTTRLKGTYAYEGPDEGASTYRFQVSSSADGAAPSTISSGSTEGDSDFTELTRSHSNKYVRYCVTPKSIGKTGQEACSGWRSVGPTATIYEDTEFSGARKVLPYKEISTNTCFTREMLTGSDSTSVYPVDGLSSYRLDYSAGLSNAAIVFYKTSDCSGTAASSTVSNTTSAGTLEESSVSSALGSSWNDSIKSLRVVWNENVTASSATLQAQGGAVQAVYTFNDAKGRPEQGTAFSFQRADSILGDNMITVQGYSSQGSYKLRPGDSEKHIRSCIKPSNGIIVGDEVCTDWMAFGKLLNLYDDANFGGNVTSYPYEAWGSGACVNVESNDQLSSYSVSSRSFTAPAGDTTAYVVTFFEHASCAGASLQQAFPSAATTSNVASVGAAWNDRVSSFRVVYRHVRALNPEVVVNGAYLDPSYTFSQSLGQPESGTKFRWHRASNAQGAGDTVVQNYSTAGRYILTPDDENRYMRLCVSPSDGVMVGPTACSEWAPMGAMVTLYNSEDYAGGATVRRSFPYIHVSGKCLNLVDYGMPNNSVRAATWTDLLFTPQPGDTKTYGTTLFDSPGCTNILQENYEVLAIDGSNQAKSRVMGPADPFRDRATSMRFFFPGYYQQQMQ